MYDRPNDRRNDRTDEQAESGHWLPLADAAAALGLRTPDALRQRIRRDRTRYRWRKSDRGDVLVWVGRPNVASDVRTVDQADTTERPDSPTAALLAERESRIAALEERLAAAEGEREELLTLRERVAQLIDRLTDRDRELAEVKAELERARALAEAERQRVDALIEALAERRGRRPWPGLRAWWRRLIEGEGRV